MTDAVIGALLPELDDVLELALKVWRDHPNPIAWLIHHGQRSFVAGKQYQGSWRPARLFPEHSGIECVELTSQDFIEVKSRLSKASLSKTALTLGYRCEIGLLETDGNARPTISKTTIFPAWGDGSDENFFRSRGIDTGVFWCNSVRDSVLELVSRPERANAIDYESFWHEQSDLVYDAEARLFILNISVTQELQESFEDLVKMIGRLANFLFEDLDGYIETWSKTITFSKYLSQCLRIADLGSFIDLAELEFFEPFDDETGRFPITSGQWVTPDAIRFRVRKAEIDPSFGTATENSWKRFELLELRKNWLITNISRVNTSSYLKRLSKQAKQTPESPITHYS
jgi:hypothetical protein